jgi:hypothetical protein
MDDQDKADLTALLLQGTPEQLSKLREGLIKIRDNLKDLNSAMPATQEFLRARGLTHVRQLDAQGNKELLNYLQKLHDELYKVDA